MSFNNSTKTKDDISPTTATVLYTISGSNANKGPTATDAVIRPDP